MSSDKKSQFEYVEKLYQKPVNIKTTPDISYHNDSSTVTVSQSSAKKTVKEIFYEKCDQGAYMSYHKFEYFATEHRTHLKIEQTQCVKALFQRADTIQRGKITFLDLELALNQLNSETSRQDDLDNLSAERKDSTEN